MKIRRTRVFDKWLKDLRDPRAKARIYEGNGQNTPGRGRRTLLRTLRLPWKKAPLNFSLKPSAILPGQAIAQRLNLNREGLYKSFSAKGNPSFITVARVLDMLGFQLNIQHKNAS
jgi:hypothetical protein